MVIKRIGLDLGYAYTTLCDVSAGVYREPSVALVDKNTNRTLALGNAALDMPDPPQDAVLVRPFKNGLLYSRELTYSIISNAVSALMPAQKIRCVLGVPSDIAPKQEKELCGLVCQAGAAECYGVHRSVAALIGAGYSPTMSVISVNVGAAYTEVTVMHGGQVILSGLVQVGGEDFDRAVKEYILQQGDVNVSLSVARAIKEKLGAVWEGKEADNLDIEGTLSLTGNRVSMNLTSEDMAGAFEKPLQRFLLAVADTVKKIPPDVTDAVFENGIVLTGGGAMLFGMDRMIAKVLDIPAVLARDPMDCVARGLSRINTFLPSRIRTGKDVTAALAGYYETRKNGTT